MENTPKNPTGRGGPGRGQGRARIAPPSESTEYKLRMSKAQRAKLDRIGGAAFLRNSIDEAPEPPAPKGKA